MTQGDRRLLLGNNYCWCAEVLGQYATSYHRAMRTSCLLEVKAGHSSITLVRYLWNDFCYSISLVFCFDEVLNIQFTDLKDKCKFLMSIDV